MRNAQLTSDQSGSVDDLWLQPMLLIKLTASDWEVDSTEPSVPKKSQTVRVCLWTPETDWQTKSPFRFVYLCIPHVFHRDIHHVNIPSAKCIYHLSVCSCHGSSCWGSRELDHTDASVVSVKLISCVVHPSIHLEAMINRSVNAKYTFHMHCVQRCVLRYTIMWWMTFVHRCVLPSFYAPLTAVNICKCVCELLIYWIHKLRIFNIVFTLPPWYTKKLGLAQAWVQEEELVQCIRAQKHEGAHEGWPLLQMSYYSSCIPVDNIT